MAFVWTSYEVVIPPQVSGRKTKIAIKIEFRTFFGRAPTLPGTASKFISKSQRTFRAKRTVQCGAHRCLLFGSGGGLSKGRLIWGAILRLLFKESPPWRLWRDHAVERATKKRGKGAFCDFSLVTLDFLITHSCSDWSDWLMSSRDESQGHKTWVSRKQFF